MVSARVPSGGPVRSWWDARTVRFRRVVRTAGLLVVTGVVSLLLGVVTATASSPVGPHQAQWSTTVDGRLTLDLGMLGTVSMDSPAGPLGVRVLLEEIPADGANEHNDPAALGKALTADGSSYLALVQRPELTIREGLWALGADAMRRAGLVESVILCLVAAGRLAAGGRLRDAVRAGLGHGPASALAAVTAAVVAVALVVPAVRPQLTDRRPVPALAGTRWAGVQVSGRVADVISAYGPELQTRLRRNNDFYQRVNTNLDAAWKAALARNGRVDVTAAHGSVDQASLDAAQQELPTAASPASGGIVAVMTTDLHCNLDMIDVAGHLDRLVGPDVHMDDGDLTMTGSDPENLCVDALTGAVPAGVARVATIGNHDSSATERRLRAKGWTVTDGTVQQVAGLSVLGAVDADRTPATGNRPRGDKTSLQIGEELAATSCASTTRVDVVLIHQPATFDPLIDNGCAPLLLAGHLHAEKGMSVTNGQHGAVAHLISGAGKGGTSVGPVLIEAYLHVLSFDSEGTLVAWRAITVRPDASVTVGAWQPVSSDGTPFAAPGTPAPSSSPPGDTAAPDVSGSESAPEG